MVTTDYGPFPSHTDISLHFPPFTIHSLRIQSLPPIFCTCNRSRKGFANYLQTTKTIPFLLSCANKRLNFYQTSPRPRLPPLTRCSDLVSPFLLDISNAMRWEYDMSCQTRPWTQTTRPHQSLAVTLCICDPMSRCDQWWLVLAIHHLRLVCARERERGGESCPGTGQQSTVTLPTLAHSSSAILGHWIQLNRDQIDHT